MSKPPRCVVCERLSGGRKLCTACARSYDAAFYSTSHAAVVSELEWAAKRARAAERRRHLVDSIRHVPSEPVRTKGEGRALENLSTREVVKRKKPRAGR